MCAYCPREKYLHAFRVAKLFASKLQTRPPTVLELEDTHEELNSCESSYKRNNGEELPHNCHSLHFGQHSVEPLVAHLHAVCHAGCERLIAVGLRGKLDRGCHVRDTASFPEGDGHDRWFAPHGNAQVAWIVDLGMHDSRVRNDFQDLASESELLAVLVAAPAPAILSADAHIHLADRHRPTGEARAPTTHQVRFHVGPPHQFDGSIEAPLDEYLGI